MPRDYRAIIKGGKAIVDHERPFSDMPPMRSDKTTDLSHYPDSFLDNLPVHEDQDSRKHTDPRYHSRSAYFQGVFSYPRQPTIKPVKPSSQEDPL